MPFLRAGSLQPAGARVTFMLQYWCRWMTGPGAGSASAAVSAESAEAERKGESAARSGIGGEGLVGIDGRQATPLALG